MTPPLDADAMRAATTATSARALLVTFGVGLILGALLVGLVCVYAQTAGFRALDARACTADLARAREEFQDAMTDSLAGSPR